MAANRRTVIAAWKSVDRTVKVCGTLAAVVAGLTLVLEPVSREVDLLTAWRFGVKGYVYYEVGQDRSTTAKGQFYLVRAGPGDFRSIRPGDKLQGVSSDSTSLREKPTQRPDAHSAVIFVVHKGECVIVLGKDHEVAAGEGLSGGWLHVATAACGFFR